VVEAGSSTRAVVFLRVVPPPSTLVRSGLLKAGRKERWLSR